MIQLALFQTSTGHTVQITLRAVLPYLFLFVCCLALYPLNHTFAHVQVFWQLGLLHSLHSSFPDPDLVSKYNAWAKSSSVDDKAEDAFKAALGFHKVQLSPAKSNRKVASPSSSGIMGYVWAMSPFRSR